MASGNVTGVNSLLNAGLDQSATQDLLSTTSVKGSDLLNFNDIMTSATRATSTNTSNNTYESVYSLQSAKSSETVVVDSKFNDDSSRTISVNASETDDAVNNNVKTAVEKDDQAIIEEVAVVFNVSEEEVQEAMAALGMDVIDLFNPQALTQLGVSLSGITDQAELLTSSDLYANISQLLEFLEDYKVDLSESLGISSTQLDTAIENLSAGLNAEIILANMPEMMNEAGEYMTVDDPETTARVEIDVNNESAVDVGNLETGMANIEAEGTTDFTQMSENVIQAEAGTEAISSMSEAKTGEESLNQNQNQGGNGENKNTPEVTVTSTKPNEEVLTTRVTDDGETQPLFEQLVDGVRQNTNIENPIVQNPNQVLQSYQSVDPADIMRQVTQAIRLDFTADTTTMEMQLHPQSLGNITVMLTQDKDGNMAAQLQTQSESVKEALESQITQLIRQFDERGVKVTEIRISVETQAFDQNLEQGRDRNAEEAYERGGRIGASRGINLNEIDLEEMNEMGLSREEILNAEMMAANGNTVDYKA